MLVSPNANATTLVNQIVGTNVTITNAVLKCDSRASGIFLSNGSNIGLNNGIVLATGKVTGAMGPNNTASYGDCFNINPNFFDPQIMSIEPKATYDGCILEFDIIPVCNTLQIKYVFGSEEYPEFVGSQYNDAFGFFISGPNPGGGSYSSLNIARLPNLTPVAINNINNGSANAGPCSNCGFYVNNTNGATVQYDGFTTPLTASVDVTPCNTYHLKLAIADAGDCDYDSGVFLEYKGISCATTSLPHVVTQTTTSMCDLNNGTAMATISNYTGAVSYLWSPSNQTSATATNLAPGTYNCFITFQNPCPFTYTTTAVVPHNSGFTFTNSITNIKCPQDVNGSATVTPTGGTAPYNYVWNTFPVQNTANASGLALGNYVCTITDANGCVKKDTVKIFASTTLTLNPTSTDALCNNATGTANAMASGGVPPYNFSWNTAPVQTSSVATALLPGNYSVTVTDNDGCIKTMSVTVFNSVPTINFKDSVLDATCNQSNGAIFINSLSGGTNPYQFLWSGGENTQNISALAAGSYTVQVTDANNCTASKIYTINNFNYLPIQKISVDDKCDLKKGSAQALVLGGTAPITYSWSNTQTTPIATGLGEGTYTVWITDAAGCKNSTVFTINNSNDNFNGSVDINPRIPTVGENFIVVIHPTSLWNLDYALLGDGSILRDTTNVLNYEDYGDYGITYYLTSDNGCKFSFRYDFFVKDYMTLYFPNTFTPNDDGVNDVYFPIGTLVKDFKMNIFDRWGQQIFTTNDLYKGWDGKFKGSPAQQDTYTYKAWATDFFGKAYSYVGHVNLIR